MKLLEKLQHSFTFWTLLATSFAFFLMRLPSFFEPYWYGDEGVYEVLGYGMRHGRMLYAGIWDNKPPLLYLIYGLFDGNQTWVRIFSFVVGLAAIVVFFSLSRLLFTRQKYTLLATALFTVLLGLPLIEGNIANAENFMVLPTIVAMYLVVRMLQKKSYPILLFLLSGFLLGVSFLIKVVAVFDFAALFLIIGFVLFAFRNDQILNLFPKLLFLSIGFFLPLLATVGFFASKGLLHTFIQSAFLSNVGYVNYGNQLFIPQGFLILKLLLLGAFVLFVFVKRNMFSLTKKFVYLWTAFSLYNAFFSQRPYTHYVLVLIMPLSLLAALLWAENKKIITGIFLVIVVGLVAKNFYFNVNFPFYYTNFAEFLLGTKTVNQYQSFFDSGVPRDYAVADFLNQNLTPTDTAFLWTNSAQLYYLIHRLPPGRYTVAYHITTSQATENETAVALQKENPRFIVVLPNSPSFPFPAADYKLKVVINHAFIYEKLF